MKAIVDNNAYELKDNGEVFKNGVVMVKVPAPTIKNIYNTSTIYNVAMGKTDYNKAYAELLKKNNMNSLADYSLVKVNDINYILPTVIAKKINEDAKPAQEMLLKIEKKIDELNKKISYSNASYNEDGYHMYDVKALEAEIEALENGNYEVVKAEKEVNVLVKAEIDDEENEVYQPAVYKKEVVVTETIVAIVKLNKSQIMVKAHAIAKASVKEYGSYHKALSVALKNVYASQKK